MTKNYDAAILALESIAGWRTHRRVKGKMVLGNVNKIAAGLRGDVPSTSQLLDQPQRELLTVILDPLVGLIEANTAVNQFTSVPTPEVRPNDLAGPI